MLENPGLSRIFLYPRLLWLIKALKRVGLRVPRLQDKEVVYIVNENAVSTFPKMAWPQRSTYA